MARIHYLYKITNKLNGRFYIGIHSTEDINDGYMGSGSLIMQAIKKYGKKNFEKTIIKYCETREKLVELEERVVNKRFVARKDTYNLSTGGAGAESSWEKSNEKIAYKLKNDPVWVENRNRNISIAVNDAMRNGRCPTATREFQLLRNKKSLTEEAIQKRKATYARNKHQQKENHALYGKKAINNGVSWKWIYKEDLDKYLESGWKLGKLKPNRAN
jgi:hypothetical protein